MSGKSSSTTFSIGRVGKMNSSEIWNLDKESKLLLNEEIKNFVEREHTSEIFWLEMEEDSNENRKKRWTNFLTNNCFWEDDFHLYSYYRPEIAFNLMNCLANKFNLNYIECEYINSYTDGYDVCNIDHDSFVLKMVDGELKKLKLEKVITYQLVEYKN